MSEEFIAEAKLLTKQKLKSLLSEAGVNLSTQDEPKEYYVKLYAELKTPPGTPVAPESVRKSTTKLRQSTAAKRLRENQSESANDDVSKNLTFQEDEDEEKAPKKQRLDNKQDESAQPPSPVSDQQPQQTTSEPTAVPAVRPTATSSVSFAPPANGASRRKTTAGGSVFAQPPPKTQSTSRRQSTPHPSKISQNIFASAPRRSTGNFVSPLLQQRTTSLNEAGTTAPLQQEPSPIAPAEATIPATPSSYEERTPTKSNRSFSSSASTPSRSRQRNTSTVAKFALNSVTLGIWALIFFGLYIAFFRGVDHSKPHGLPYCDSDPTTLSVQGQCQPCPNHGYCIEGKLVDCEEGFKVKNAICVEQEQIGKLAWDFVQQKQTELRILAGKAFCGEDVKAGITVEDMQKELHDFLEQQSEAEKYDLCMPKVAALLNEANMRLEMKDIDGVKQWISTDPNIPLSCLIRTRLQAHAIPIGVILVMIFAIFAFNIFKKRAEQLQYDVESIATETLRVLREEPAAHSIASLRDHMKDLFREVIQSDFNELWKLVEGEMQRDARIKEVENDDQEKCWQYAGPRASIAPSSMKPIILSPLPENYVNSYPSPAKDPQ